MIAQAFLISDLFPLRYSKTREMPKSGEIRLCWRKIFCKINTGYEISQQLNFPRMQMIG